MANQSTDSLVQLIQSLSKGEKRHFRLLTNKNGSTSDKLFMKLFDVIDRSGEYDESKLFKKIPQLKRSQLSNLKATLYKRLLSSLRLQQRNIRTDIEIRENLDYAKILYDKGLYNASLQILDRIKKLALEKEYISDLLPIVEFEKHIESQHITGSMYPKAAELTTLTNHLINKFETHNKLANLSLSLYGKYLQYGFVKNKQELEFITRYFFDRLPEVQIETLNFNEKLYLYQSYVWYYFMSQDFLNYYRYTQKWVDLFYSEPVMIERSVPLYLKGVHNLLNAAFMAQRYDKFVPIYEILLNFNQDNAFQLNANETSLHILYKHMHKMNEALMTAQYEEAIPMMQDLEQILDSNEYNWDLHKQINLYYKLAGVYFCHGNLDKAIEYLNKITNQTLHGFREDIQSYARILNLIAHFDLGNNLLVSYQLKSTYRFLLKKEELQKVLKEILDFIRKTPSMTEVVLKREFIKLKARLVAIEGDRFERRPYLYLDIISWLDSKIHNRTMQESVLLRIKNSK